jgi:hypothetical protein
MVSTVHDGDLAETFTVQQVHFLYLHLPQDTIKQLRPYPAHVALTHNPVELLCRAIRLL